MKSVLRLKLEIELKELHRKNANAKVANGNANYLRDATCRKMAQTQTQKNLRTQIEAQNRKRKSQNRKLLRGKGALSSEDFATQFSNAKFASAKICDNLRHFASQTADAKIFALDSRKVSAQIAYANILS